MPSSVVRMITADHDRLARLLRRMSAVGPNRARWQSEFSGLLRAHRLAERDQVLRPVARDVPDLAVPVHDLAAHDVDVDHLVDDLDRVDAGRPEFAQLCARAADVLAAHADLTGGAVLARLEALVPRREVRRLGGEYERRREAELRRALAQEPVPRRLDVSRAELYEMAKRAGIEGRSTMSRAELIERLRHHQH